VAILFENGSYVNYDSIITVTASEEKRIERVMKRDGSSKKKIKAIMKNQWTDEDKIKLSDHVIYNDDLEEVLKQVKSLHKKLVRKSEKH
jgi:dephospho-CoA kinase